MKRWLLTKKQIWFVILVLIIVGLLIDLNTRISTLTYLREQKELLETDVVSLQATLDVISEEILYADSDTAVESWARQQGLMMQEDDNVIIPLPVHGPTPVPTPVPTVQPVVYENWEIWKALIFD
jgi:hypothetical protein